MAKLVRLGWIVAGAALTLGACTCNTPGGPVSCSDVTQATGTGSGSAGNGATTGSAGSGSAGSGSAGTGAAGTGSAGTGSEGRDAGVDAAPGGDASVDRTGDASGDATRDAMSVDGPPLRSVAGAVIVATTGNHELIGTATFRDNAGIVTLGISLMTGCFGSTHNFHLQVNNVCGADGTAAGGPWTPRGDTNLGVVTCMGNGTGSGLYVTPSAGYWTIGGDDSTNILNHALVVDGNSTDPAALIGCGVPQ